MRQPKPPQKTAEIRLDLCSPCRRCVQQKKAGVKELKGPPALLSILVDFEDGQKLSLPDRETTAGQMNTWIKATK